MKNIKTMGAIRSLLFVMVGGVILSLGGCGGGDTTSTATSSTALVTGAGVKGPLVNAIVLVHSVNLEASDLKGALLGEAVTGSDAAIQDLEIEKGTEGLALVEYVVQADTVELYTGATPTYSSLISVVDFQYIYEGYGVYATPLTTMVVNLAQKMADTGLPYSGDGNGIISQDEFEAALIIAKNVVLSTLGFGLDSGTDIFMSPPLLTDDTDTEAEQRMVISYRQAVEALASLTIQVADGSSATDTPQDILDALVDDLTDGVIDGVSRDGVVPVLAALDTPIQDTINSLNLLLLTIPGTTTPVSDIETLLVDEITETHTTVDSSNISSGAIYEDLSPPQVVGDSDGDGLSDNYDPFPYDGTETTDSDGDGVGDNSDPFPNDPGEWLDTDGDGIGNNADTDDDNDGVADSVDAYPLDPDRWLDDSVPATSWVGTKMLGTDGSSTDPMAVSVDTLGNVIVAGYVHGGLDGETATGITNSFFTKYDANGNKLFTRLKGAANEYSYGRAVATDSANNIYVAGDTTGSFMGITMGVSHGFLLKYDADGNEVKQQQLNAFGKSVRINAIAIDSNDNVIVAGTTDGSFARTVQGVQELIMAKYDKDLTPLHYYQTGVVSKVTYGTGVTVDAAGNVYLIGHTTGDLEGETNNGVNALYLMKFDDTLAVQYTRLTSAADVYGYSDAVAVDASNNVYMTGYTSGSQDSQAMTGTEDMIFMKYDSAGVKVFTKLLGATGVQTHGTGLVLDLWGDVYISGRTSGDLHGNTAIGDNDSYLAKYDSTGNLQSVNQYGVPDVSLEYENLIATDIQKDTDGNLFMVGGVNADYDGNTLVGRQDLFVMKFDSLGTKQ